MIASLFATNVRHTLFLHPSLNQKMRQKDGQDDGQIYVNFAFRNRYLRLFSFWFKWGDEPKKVNDYCQDRRESKICISFGTACRLHESRENGKSRVEWFLPSHFFRRSAKERIFSPFRTGKAGSWSMLEQSKQLMHVKANQSSHQLRFGQRTHNRATLST